MGDDEDGNQSHRRHAAEVYLDAAPDLDAAVCYGMADACVLLDAAARRRVRVPDDLELVAFHDALIHRHAGLPIRTAEIPFRHVGSAAAGLLLDLLDARAAPGPAAPHLVPYQVIHAPDAAPAATPYPAPDRPAGGN